MKTRSVFIFVLCITMLLSSVGCSNAGGDSKGYNTDTKNASSYTAEANKEFYNLLDFSDNEEFEFANRGFIDAPETLEIKDSAGNIIWSQETYRYLDEMDEAPDTVNPSLWRNTQLNHIYGLFKVKDGIYQVRGYDMSNLTLIESDTGWIVFDVLTCVENAQAAMALVEKNLGKRPVVAVVISHSHVDHYGGIKGVVSEEDVLAQKVQIIAPEGFEQHVASENVYAGNAMKRRAAYQYGLELPKNDKGAAAIGIGMGQSNGTISYISPTKTIRETGESLEIDGVVMEFQMTPGTEAPAEMNTFFPELNALWMAENCTGTLHNLYTLRGAEVRDGNAWSNFIGETISLYGGKTDVVFQAHNWPHFGEDTLETYLKNTARVYKSITDQALRLINMGYTQNEVAEMVKLSPELEKVWYTRQYYGTVAHNAKAVYQKYMGWYDANPANLYPLPPVDSAIKTISYMGGAEAVIKRAKQDFDQGEYRFVAEVLNLVVFADPGNEAAKLLLADTYEQLGYQAESGTWRNAYLTGAMELRHGKPELESAMVGAGDTIKAMTAPMIFDYVGILIDVDKAAGIDADIQVRIIDKGTKNLTETWYLSLADGALIYWNDNGREDADIILTAPKDELAATFMGVPTSAVIEGDNAKWAQLLETISPLNDWFDIVTP